MKVFLAFASICLLAASTASAHDTWLLSRTAAASNAGWTFDLTSGMAFPELDSAIAADRVAVAQYRLANDLQDIAPGISSGHSLVFQTRAGTSGPGTAWVSLKPRQLELERSKIGEYLDEIGASAALRATVKQQQDKRWREVYTKHAKTFTASKDANQTAKDRSWSQPTQQALEIVPDVNPLQLKAGDALKAHVLKHGRPFPGFVVGIVGAKNTSISFQTTDADGRVSFTIPGTGRWLLRGTDLRASTKPDIEWESDFTTLTFDVR